MLESSSGIWTGLISAFDSIPEDSIAVTIYLLAALVILWCWDGLAKRLPHPAGSVSWIVLFAFLLTPTVSEGNNASIAPAIFGLLFGILTKQSLLVWTNLSAILFVTGLGLIIGYFWSKYNTAKKAYKNTPPL